MVKNREFYVSNTSVEQDARIAVNNLNVSWQYLEVVQLEIAQQVWVSIVTKMFFEVTMLEIIGDTTKKTNCTKNGIRKTKFVKQSLKHEIKKKNKQSGHFDLVLLTSTPNI